MRYLRKQCYYLYDFYEYLLKVKPEFDSVAIEIRR